MLKNESSVDEEEKGDSILKCKFKKALKELRKRKAPGVDDISIKLIKFSGDKTLDTLYELVCKMNETGEVPADFQKNIIVTLPKVTGTDRNHRTISLTYHASNILPRIMYRRMKHEMEEKLLRSV